MKIKINRNMSWALNSGVRIYLCKGEIYDGEQAEQIHKAGYASEVCEAGNGKQTIQTILDEGEGNAEEPEQACTPERESSTPTARPEEVKEEPVKRGRGRPPKKKEPML